MLIEYFEIYMFKWPVCIENEQNQYTDKVITLLPLPENKLLVGGGTKQWGRNLTDY